MIMQRDDGGPAFPHDGRDNGPGNIKGRPHDGMNLRDWFAGQAPEPSAEWLHMMRGVDRARNPHNDPHKPAPRDEFQLIAEYKFAMADAMIEARSK